MLIKFMAKKPIETKNVKAISKKINNEAVKYIYLPGKQSLYIKRSFTEWICIYNVNIYQKHISDLQSEIILYTLDNDIYGSEFDIILSDILSEIYKNK